MPVLDRDEFARRSSRRPSARNVSPRIVGLVVRSRGERFVRSLHVVPVIAERGLVRSHRGPARPARRERSDRDAVRWIGRTLIGPTARDTMSQDVLTCRKPRRFEDRAPGDVLGHDRRPDRMAPPARPVALGLGPREEHAADRAHEATPERRTSRAGTVRPCPDPRLPCANASTPSGPVDEDGVTGEVHLGLPPDPPQVLPHRVRLGLDRGVEAVEQFHDRGEVLPCGRSRSRSPPEDPRSLADGLLACRRLLRGRLLRRGLLGRGLLGGGLLRGPAAPEPRPRRRRRASWPPPRWPSAPP